VGGFYVLGAGWRRMMGRKSLGDDDSCCFLHPLSLVFTGGILISGSPWSPPPPPLPVFHRQSAQQHFLLVRQTAACKFFIVECDFCV